VCLQSVEVDGRPVQVWGIDTLRGSDDLEIVSGRAPTEPDEVALGAVTLRDAHKHIGDTVSVHGDRATRPFKIVGQVVLPSITEPQPLADGAAFTKVGLSPLLVKGHDETHYLLVRYAPGADVGAIKRALRTDKRVRILSGSRQQPTEIARLQQINWFPAILATLLATLALVAVGHTLVSGVRRRRRELALYKTIGFDHRQVGATVAWQASTIAVVGVVVGIPIGLIVGRLVWRAVADSLGVAQFTTTPVWAIVLTAAAALVLANVVAFLPGRAAARTRPAVALRAE
jgi:predicted lysophospholipase L1 biosynthesis ABC-type transport system permease subunit